MKNTSKFYCQYLHSLGEHCRNPAGRDESDIDAKDEEKEFCWFHQKNLSENCKKESRIMLQLYYDGIIDWKELTPREMGMYVRGGKKVKTLCECGGRYLTEQGKTLHLKSKKHMKFVAGKK
jgi:hypothetical protein